MAEEQDLQAKRRAAQLAMEGDFWQQKRKEKEEIVNKRRLDAQKAMESPERKERRREEELVAKRAAQTAEQAEAEKKALAEAEANKAKSVAADAAAQEAARVARFGKIAAAEQQITKMVQAPAASAPMPNAVRTLRSDLAQAAQKNQVSMAGIAIKQEEKRRADLGAMVNTEPKKSHGFLISLVILMILIGLGALGYAYWLKNGNPFSPNPILPPVVPGQVASTTTPALIFSDRKSTVEISTDSTPTQLRSKIMEAVAAIDRPSATIEQIVFVKNGRPVNLPTWQTDLKLGLPEELLTTLTKDFMIGVYHHTAGERGAPFLILTTTNTNYEKTFATLKTAEPKLTQPLAIIGITQAPILTSASSTTPQQSSGQATPGWSDRSIYNSEVRVWPTADAPTGLYYTFLDRTTIAFTPNQATLVEILTRFRTAN